MKKLTSILLPLLLIAALLTVPASALETDYVIDMAEVLTDSEVEILTSAAADISAAYGVDVYIATIDDMRDYGFYDIEECAEVFYEEMFGRTTGIMLILSLAERDYDIDAFGDYAHYAFTDYGKTTISDAFLDNFRQNDWYGGFFDYLARCEEMLALADAGTPVDVPPPARFTAAGAIVSALLGLLGAWGVCGLFKRQLKSAVIATDANAYARPDETMITYRDDRFTHITTSRRRIERDSGGGRGGTTVSSGGHSHSSGKF